MGSVRYPHATSLTITADGGGSNGSRVRLWKIELQKLADELGLAITVHHLPPGTSKWNKIEHRLFSFITGNWRGKPLVSHQVIVQTHRRHEDKAGLTVRCRTRSEHLSCRREGVDDEFKAVELLRHEFHGEWNYTIRPSGLVLDR